MNKYDIKRLALVLAIQAEIEGMKAENAYTRNTGDYVAYTEKPFLEKADELRNIAYANDDQFRI